MLTPLSITIAGQGARIVFVHGSAADHTSWKLQLTSELRERFELVAYDRRGTDVSIDQAQAAEGTSVMEHAEDLLDMIEGRMTTHPPLQGAGPVIAVGSSFGAVVVLTAARRRPACFGGVVLCEPPLAPADAIPHVSAEFLERFDALVADAGGEAAAEHFMRSALGDATYDRMPRALQARAKARWQQIRSDTRALATYRVGYDDLGAMTVPTLLLGGERSSPYFRPTLKALARHLGRARLTILAGAGHMVQAEAPQAFNDELAAFANELASAAASPR